MFMSRSDYDTGINTFSPEGRLIQVEYALEAVKLGSTAIGIRCTDGVVLAVEKRLTSTMVVPASNKKIFEIDSHIGCAMSGLTADGLRLVKQARIGAQDYWFDFNEPAPVDCVLKEMSAKYISFGPTKKAKDKMSRPFGVAFLLGSYNHHDNAYRLSCIDPSGTYVDYDVKSIGAGSIGAQELIKELYKNDLDVKQGAALLLKILKDVMEDKISQTNVEVCVVSDKKYKTMPVDEIEEIIKTL